MTRIVTLSPRFAAYRRSAVICPNWIEKAITTSAFATAVVVVVDDGGTEEVVVGTSEVGTSEVEGGGGGDEVLDEADVLEGDDPPEVVRGCVGGGDGDCVAGTTSEVETAEVDVPERRVCDGAEVEEVEPVFVEPPQEGATAVRTTKKATPNRPKRPIRGRFEAKTSSNAGLGNYLVNRAYAAALRQDQQAGGKHGNSNDEQQAAVCSGVSQGGFCY